MANPFEVTKPDLTKKVDGQQPVQTTGRVSRFVQVYAYLQSMDVYSLASGGQTFNFQNYDGFQRTTNSDDASKIYSSGMKKAGAAKSAARSASGEADTSRAGAEKSAALAKENVVTLRDGSQDARTRTTRAVRTMTANNNQVQRLTLENDSIVSDTEDLNREIEELMAEDGETYTAPEVTNPIPAAAPAGGNNQGGAPMAAPAGDNMFAMGGGNFGGAQGGNFFAMNSLPSVQQSPVPTSETAVAATRSAEGVQGGQGVQGAQGAQGGRQSAPASSPSSSRGSSVIAFASTVLKGKNSDKIAALQAKVSANQTTLSLNASSVATFNAKTSSLYNQTFNYLNGVTKTASQIKGTSETGSKNAQTTQKVGQVTTYVGSGVSAVGAVLSAIPYTAAAGMIVSAAGAATTATGTITTSVGQSSQGNNEGALNSANSAISSLKEMNTQINSFKATKN